MTAAAGSSSSNSQRSDPLASTGTDSTLLDGNASHCSRKSPRSLPPWIDSYEARYGAPTDDQFQLLNTPPPRAQAPQHNNAPAPPQRKIRRVSKDGYVDFEDDGPVLSEANKPKLLEILRRRGVAERGRKWDHLRSADPVVVSGVRSNRVLTPNSTESPWQDFLHSSAYGHMPNEEAEVVDPEVLNKLQPGFDVPMMTPSPSDLKKAKRAKRTVVLYRRVWRMIINHPLVPLLFRLTVLLTSIIALALSARIFETEANESSAEKSQAIVAIVVDTLAIPYIGYMTWDEYTGKPLGLRPATQKISLVLMDLFFIIFKSSSTTLAFESLVYHTYADDDSMARVYARALAAFQTVGLISWTLTFTIQVYRLIQRLGGGEDEGRRGRHIWAGGHG